MKWSNTHSLPNQTCKFCISTLKIVDDINKLVSPIGESVILFDSNKAIPPHPSLIHQQVRPKKTWLDTVAGAFTREPLTLPELDLLSK